MRGGATIGRVAGVVLDAVLPPRCPACAAIVTAPHRFCAGCWSQLRFPGPPWCAACHRPFDHDRGAGARCEDCLSDPPVHGGVRAAVAYGDVARAVALKLKYGGRTGLAITAAGLMRRHLPADADLLVPVPLHRWRIWQRGYNQAALIATALGREAGIAVDRHALRRCRATPSLRGLSRGERRRALAGAFAIHDAAAVAGRRVVLIDDVHTSGATADGCAAALRAAGARSVLVLAWARVLDPRPHGSAEAD
ncbi:ComF family protein [Sphingomonas corticis]|jgi:ComF family protein|uniref:ComF family protein n=1 Tax=Sphingomonas corticis TaxID=2722791 RepID=A0ABX1CKB4_9SPHN|nr:ComF family protein [Sphingomonas corticis]NJR77193.1 ComF family protein [Sphingomonas corticis]